MRTVVFLSLVRRSFFVASVVVVVVFLYASASGWACLMVSRREESAGSRGLGCGEIAC